MWLNENARDAPKFHLITAVPTALKTMLTGNSWPNLLRTAPTTHRRARTRGYDVLPPESVCLLRRRGPTLLDAPKEHG